MRTQIKSKKLNTTFNFWMRDNGGYVYLETDGKPGATGSQICYGGGFMGSTVSATPDSFETVCRKWYRAHLRSESECCA